MKAHRFHLRQEKAAKTSSVPCLWGREIWPKIEQDYKKLLSSPPVTQVDGAIGAAFTQDKILEKVRLTGEARGYTGVLAWFQPLQGPDCQTFTIAMVDKCVSAYFRDAEGKLRAPDLWWRGSNGSRSWHHIVFFFSVSRGSRQGGGQGGQGATDHKI